MKSSSVELSIGELAARFGLAPHVLRHWESIGLLRPARRVNGRRRYTAEHVGLVALILRGKDAGFSLEQMRDLLVAPDGETRRALLTDHLAALDAKIAQLQRARALVEHTLKCTADDFLTCLICTRFSTSWWRNRWRCRIQRSAAGLPVWPGRNRRCSLAKG